MSTVHLSEIVVKIEMLPMLPQLFHELIETLDNLDSTTSDIVHVIEKDQVIASRVLKTINSSFYSFPKKISSIDKSVKILGRSVLKNLITINSILRLTNSANISSEFWRHSFAVGITSKNIGAKIRYRELEEIFMCGLLHDIGKVGQMYISPSEINKILSRAKVLAKPFYVVEKEFFDLGHDKVGSMILKKWKLPDKLINAIEFHHAPMENPVNKLESVIIYIADSLVRKLGIGEPMDGNQPIPITKEHLEFIGMSSDDIRSLADSDAIKKITDHLL
jgi:putative nucleotidyltransferase with HDIG domain